jgi:TIR domain
MPDPASPRVLISYAHESPEHTAEIERLYRLLRANGIDAQLDLVAAEEPQDWVHWMTGEIRKADHVLMVISPSYKRRFESDEPAEHGAGVGWEARIIRDEIYRDQAGARRKFLTVLLPGGRREDIPLVLQPGAGSRYYVTDFTLAGAESLIRWLTRQPAHMAPQLGPIPHLPPMAALKTEPAPGPIPHLAGANAASLVLFQLVITARDSYSSEQIVDAMTKAVEKRAESVRLQQRSNGKVAGAVVMIAADFAAELIEASIRAIHQQVRTAVKSAPSLAARIGLDVEHSPLSSVEQVAGRLVECRTARAMHGVRGANLVVAASPAFHSWAIDAKVGFPAPRSYREVADESVPGGTFWIAVPGRSVCPQPPEPPDGDDVDSFEGHEGTRPSSARYWFPENHGVVSIQGDHSKLHIGDIRHGESP